MSATELIEEKLTDEGTVVVTKKSGDFVVCNLSSIHLGNATKEEGILERLIPIQVRMLDNVVDLNTVEVPQVRDTNKRYRAIGLGYFSLHQVFANNKIKWESQEAVDFTNKLLEKVAYLTVKASMELAKEKGAYPLFKGSDWENGKHLEYRGYFDEETAQLPVEKWKALQEDIQKYGLRNANHLAPAPNGSTSVIAGGTASLDPIFDVFYYEEKKSYKLPIVAPDLSYETYPFYNQPAYQLDQFWSVKIREQIQRNIDQASSFNLFVPNTIKASVLLNLHMEIWKRDIKTTYYVRSTSTRIEECEWCSA